MPGPSPLPDLEAREPPSRIQALMASLRFEEALSGEEALHARVYRTLREALLSGAVAPGDQLNIRPIAAALGTSPMPVREALARLVGDGALESLANRAFRVPLISTAIYRELLLIRLRLECLAAEHAAVRATPAQIEGLHEVHDRLRVEGRSSLQTYLVLNRRFHFDLYRAAAISSLYDLIETMWLRIGPLLHACSGEHDHDNAVACHGDLLNALSSGDAAAASRAMQQDLVLASRTIFAYLEFASGAANANVRRSRAS
jgi:DNA-binding GntR family transcriptional regulator